MPLREKNETTIVIVPGFRWHLGECRLTDDMFEDGWRPLLRGEMPLKGDEVNLTGRGWSKQTKDQREVPAERDAAPQRTKRPLPGKTAAQTAALLTPMKSPVPATHPVRTAMKKTRAAVKAWKEEEAKKKEEAKLFNRDDRKPWFRSKAKPVTSPPHIIAFSAGDIVTVKRNIIDELYGDEIVAGCRLEIDAIVPAANDDKCIVRDMRTERCYSIDASMLEPFEAKRGRVQMIMGGRAIPLHTHIPLRKPKKHVLAPTPAKAPDPFDPDSDDTLLDF